jgi:anti-anti-sigma factor
MMTTLSPATPEAAPAPSFYDVFDLEEIQALQDSFAAATGVASIITEPDGRPITRPSNFCRLCIDVIRATPKGMANCMHSDAIIGRPNPGGPIIQPCLSGGLVDGGVSIFLGDHHIANWLIGQVLDGNPDEAKMLAYARQIEADEARFREALAQVKHMPREQFEQVAETLAQVARLFSRQAEQNLRQKRDLAALRAAEEAREALQAEVIAAQEAALRELSTPLIPVAEGVLVMPLVGSIDSARAQQILENLLEGVAAHHARAAIIDITGIKVVDTQVAGALLRAAQATRLLGAEVILTGISPEVAQTLVQIGADMSALTTRGALQSGIAYALGLGGAPQAGPRLTIRSLS